MEATAELKWSASKTGRVSNTIREDIYSIPHQHPIHTQEHGTSSFGLKWWLLSYYNRSIVVSLLKLLKTKTKWMKPIYCDSYRITLKQEELDKNQRYKKIYIYITNLCQHCFFIHKLFYSVNFISNFYLLNYNFSTRKHQHYWSKCVQFVIAIKRTYQFNFSRNADIVC